MATGQSSNMHCFATFGANAAKSHQNVLTFSGHSVYLETTFTLLFQKTAYDCNEQNFEQHVHFIKSKKQNSVTEINYNIQ